MKVRYKKNGYVAEVSEAVASKLIDKGKVELIKEDKPKEEKAKPGPKPKGDDK